MNLSSIVQHPAGILLTPTATVTEFNDRLADVVKTMFELMRKFKGIGLAANQINVGLRVAVMHVPGWPEMVLVNPRITKRRGGQGTFEEGCLSVKHSGHWVPVKRDKIVHLEYQDVDGREWSMKATGLLARCVQHELDHLDGLTCLEKTKEVRP